MKRDAFFKKPRPHDSRFLTAPLCSRTGSQNRENKELAKPANLYTIFILNLHTVLILNFYTYTGAIESQSPTACYHCCWGRVGFAGDGGICSGACTFPTAGVSAPSSHPPALLAGNGKSARFSPWLSVLALLLLPPFLHLLQKWADLLSIWEQIPSLWQHWGTPIHLFLYPFLPLLLLLLFSMLLWA